MSINLDQQSIINILGIQSLPDERKVEILEQASDLIQKRILVRVMESLDDSKRKEFETLLESPEQTKLDEFLATNVPDFTVWMMEEVNRLKQEMADLAGGIE
jgi:hypothetical protein